MRARIRRSLVLVRRAQIVHRRRPPCYPRVYCGWARMSLALSISRGEPSCDHEGPATAAATTTTTTVTTTSMWKMRAATAPVVRDARRSFRSAPRPRAALPLARCEHRVPRFAPDDVSRRSPFLPPPLGLPCHASRSLARLILPFWSCRFCAFVGKRQSAVPTARRLLLLERYYRFLYADMSPSNYRKRRLWSILSAFMRILLFIIRYRCICITTRAFFFLSFFFFFFTWVRANA